MERIPSVDLSDFLSDNADRKQQFVNEIGKAYLEQRHLFHRLRKMFQAEEVAHHFQHLGWGWPRRN